AYRVLIPTSQLTFEYAALLTVGLAAAEELQLAICPHCGVLLVIDPLATHRDQCLYCNPSISATLDDLCPPHATRTTPSFWRRRSAIRRAPDDPTSPEALHHNGVRHAARTG
ncbi:MAG: hypothetical protein ACREFZ_10880, partial [Acetobacteraceae bacterium]